MFYPWWGKKRVSEPPITITYYQEAETKSMWLVTRVNSVQNQLNGAYFLPTSSYKELEDAQAYVNKNPEIEFYISRVEYQSVRQPTLLKRL